MVSRDKTAAELMAEKEAAAARDAAAYALAHARDFTVKEWEKKTKHLAVST
eukprot:SAG11_NODE_2740_length_3022_cov_2.199795_6_plen_51_part_00